MFILFDSRLKISLEKKSRQIQAESSDFILNSEIIHKLYFFVVSYYTIISSQGKKWGKTSKQHGIT